MSIRSLGNHTLSIINVSSTKAKNGKERFAIFTVFCHLHRVKQRANGYIQLTLLLLWALALQ